MIRIANVKCKFCEQTFDRTKEEYVKIKNRYAHAACALRQGFTANDVIDPLDEVTCEYCKKKFFKSQTPDFVMVKEGVYAHKACAEAESSRERTDKEKLDDYIKYLYKKDFVPPKMQKQIKEFVEKYNYSYSGIMRTLQYFYEVKKNDPMKYPDTLQIVTFVYDQAYRYYYSIWEAEQRNGPKIAVLEEKYIPKVIELKAHTPERKKKKSRFFAFLDEEGSDES